MQELHELKEMLCEELKEYGKKGELTTGSLEVVDKLTHTIKNLDKIIEKYEEDEYSGNYPYMMEGSYEGGRSYARGGNRGGSGRRGANQYGSYARRDSMGRYSREGGYSRHGDMIAELHDLMQDAPDEKTRMEFQKFIQKIEQSM